MVEYRHEALVENHVCANRLLAGAVLIIINHGDGIMQGDITPSRLSKTGLTIMVPYLASTYSSVGAIRETRYKEHA